LVPRICATAFASTESSSTTTGLLPPSSKVTGVRFSAAALAISLPTSVLPVYSRWSQRSVGNSLASSRPPVTTAARSRSNAAASIFLSSSEHAGVYSEGLMIALLPAASMSTSGPSERSNGKFQGEMFPITPFGW